MAGAVPERSGGQVPVMPPPTVFPVPSQPQRSPSRSSSSSRKRKRKRIQGPESENIPVASSPSAFSQGTKRKVAMLDGACCWYCGATPAQTCHVFEKRDSSFEDALQIGAISFNHLGHEDNAIPLCPLCHHNFDNTSNPGWIFLPTDLRFFIESEERNFAMRQTLLRETGAFHPRLCPTPAQYRDHQVEHNVILADATGGLYQRYTLRRFYSHEFLVALGAPQDWDHWIPGKGPLSPKSWHGAPTAAIHRALAILGKLFWTHLPEELHLLRRLQELYGRELQPETDTGSAAGADMGGSDDGPNNNTRLEECGAGERDHDSSDTAHHPPQGSEDQTPQRPSQFSARNTTASRGLVSGIERTTSDSGIDISSQTRRVDVRDASRKRKRASDDADDRASLRTTRHAKLPQTDNRRITAGEEDASSDVLREIAPPLQPCRLPEQWPRRRWFWGPASTSGMKARLWAGTFGAKEEESSNTGDFG
ncbi:hypothetical protein BJ546DRAFT_955643 [Cryomyces antarcticus]|uniref:HNH nuclease domain-containing protein n=1 Tax=Cryomyces antarcticus TaxID=329879 RepID=A0ABR0KSU3_9PEZI|nr:hypothetical protein LTR39_002199 [Cryomyces antarcticus]KAK5016996.1 hypothetical protein LTR60_002134 [Cryomyces antarcticus]KAK5126829.1 hypothetical protein LTR16_002988 [Cryomyces antarcticus]KAK5142065.1 hypothetical protein LTR04_002350 [Oleoguttula sp. CCFEE 6159]